MTYTVKRSRRRRTVALRVEPTGEITVLAPRFVWVPEIDRFVQKHRGWIQKMRDYFKSLPATPEMTPEQRAELARETERRLAPVLTRNAERLGVMPKSVRIAHQRRRWGSCSSKGHLRFSSRMARLPDDLFECVVIHELAHLRHMNHSPQFWAVVASACPAYKDHRRRLRETA